MVACLIGALGSIAENARAAEARPEEQYISTARKELNAILAKPEFRLKPAQETVWDRLQRRLARAIAEFLERLFGEAGAHPGGSTALLCTLIAAAIGAIGWIAFRLWSREAPIKVLGIEAPFERKRWEEWLAGAQAAADRGDGRTAIKLSYWAGVARLQQDGRLPEDRPRTPREYLRLAGVRTRGETEGGSFAGPLRLLTAKLERYWYGQHAAGVEEFWACLPLLEALGCARR